MSYYANRMYSTLSYHTMLCIQTTWIVCRRDQELHRMVLPKDSSSHNTTIHSMDSFCCIFFSIIRDVDGSARLHRRGATGIRGRRYWSLVDHHLCDLSKLSKEIRRANDLPQRIGWIYYLVLEPNSLHTSSEASFGWRPITYTRFFCTTRIFARCRRLAASISFCWRSFSFFSRFMRAIL